MNNPVYQGLSILEISKTLMYECKIMLHGYRQFIINIKIEDFCEDIADDAEKRFDTIK